MWDKSPCPKLCIEKKNVVGMKQHYDVKGHYTPHNKVVGGYTGFTMSVCRQILCRTIT